jgi:TolB-like protein
MNASMGNLGYAFGPFFFDPGRGELRRDGKAVALGQRGLALLEALLEAEGEPVSKAQLLDRGWSGTIVEEVNLSVQIAALRKALGTAPDGQEWIATVPRVGYRLPRQTPRSPVGAAQSGRPSIAVLPFANISGDHKQTYFADGVVEDIIAALSRFKTFAVVARNSSFVYRDRAVDVREAAKALGVRYVLEGAVQRRDRSVRVTAQLIDAVAGVHLGQRGSTATSRTFLTFRTGSRSRWSGSSSRKSVRPRLNVRESSDQRTSTHMTSTCGRCRTSTGRKPMAM